MTSLVTIPSIGRFKLLKPGCIHLKCRRCGKTRSNLERAEYDDPRAVVMVFGYCDRCDTGGEFEDVRYYDAAGVELMEDVS